MTFDCFSFFNELDLLEIRLNILNNVVDKFILVEAPWTHTGQKKPLFYSDNLKRYAPFLDKIIHVSAGTPPTKANASERENAWRRENFQRNEIARGLAIANVKPDDLILLSDLDEIPSPEAILMAKKLPGISRFSQRFYGFFLNYRNYSVLNWPIGTQACSYATFKDPATYAGQRYDQFLIEDVNQGPTMTKLRMAKANRIIKNGGWHFSYCGGIEAIRTKLISFAHTECNSAKATDPKFIDLAIKAGKDPISRGYRFFAEPIDESFPKYIRNNTDRFSKLILPVDSAYMRRTVLSRAIAAARGSAYRLMVRLIPRWLEPFALRIRTLLFVKRQTAYSD